MQARTKKILKRTGITLGVVTVLFFGLVGFAHTEAGRPILAWLSGHGVTGGCPLGLDQVDPAAAEAYRVKQLDKSDGKVAARSSRAMGFALGSTTRADVGLWIGAHAATCEAARAGAVLKCSAYAPVVGGAREATDLYLQFDRDDRLVAIDVMHLPTAADAAVRTFVAATAALEQDVGPATAARGEVEAGWLGGGAMRHAAREFRYAGYVATVSATNTGKAGVRVREQYQWAPQTASADAVTN